MTPREQIRQLIHHHAHPTLRDWLVLEQAALRAAVRTAHREEESSDEQWAQSALPTAEAP